MLLLPACSGTSDEAKPDTGNGTVDSGDTDDTDDTDIDTDTGSETADGSTDVAIDGAIVVTFNDIAQSADISLEPAVAGEVTMAADGSGATFTPSELLARDTSYAVTVEVCDDTATASFVTVGSAVELDLTGRTYDVELDEPDLTWVSPSLGSTLVAQLTTKSLLFGVETADEAEIDMVGAAGVDNQRGEAYQYSCTEAIDFPAVSFLSNPAFAIGPVDASLSTGDTSFSVFNLSMSGRLNEDATALEDVTVTGLLDARPITESQGIDVCALLTTMGDPCVACPDGVEQCVYLEVNDASAPWREGLVIDPYVDPATDCR
jgi:hypothetical protein